MFAYIFVYLHFICDQCKQSSFVWFSARASLWAAVSTLQTPVTTWAQQKQSQPPKDKPRGVAVGKGDYKKGCSSTCLACFYSCI